VPTGDHGSVAITVRVVGEACPSGGPSGAVGVGGEVRDVPLITHPGICAFLEGSPDMATSVRGMYYAALGYGLVDKDQAGKINNYRRVQRRILALRRSGRMPYGWITDGSRPIYGHDRYNTPGQFARQVAGQNRKEYWQDSPVRVEVWVEKDAMAGKLRPVVVEECGLDLYVSRGFSSETYLHSAGEAIRADTRPTHVYLLTDFDASGMGIAETVARDLPMHRCQLRSVNSRPLPSIGTASPYQESQEENGYPAHGGA